MLLENRLVKQSHIPLKHTLAEIDAFACSYNHHRYHECLGNLIPADVNLGRGQSILREKENIKRQTFEQRRLQHQQQAALIIHPEDPDPFLSRATRRLKDHDDGDLSAVHKAFYPAGSARWLSWIWQLSYRVKAYLHKHRVHPCRDLLREGQSCRYYRFRLVDKPSIGEGRDRGSYGR